MYSRRQKQEKYYTAAAGAHNTDSAVFTQCKSVFHGQQATTIQGHKQLQQWTTIA
jgi:hypothetical protein